MENFKEFLASSSKNSNSKELAVDTVSRELAKFNVSNDIASVLIKGGVLNSQSKAEKFGQDAAKLAASDEVLSELSNALGIPSRNETESEFVSRAKQSLKKILMAKLSGK